MAEDEALKGMGGNNFGGDFSPGNESPMLGVNSLQSAIDKFDDAVNKLSDVTGKMASAFQGGPSSYGHPAASPQQVQAAYSQLGGEGFMPGIQQQFGQQEQTSPPGTPAAGAGGGKGATGFGPGMRAAFGKYQPNNVSTNIGGVQINTQKMGGTLGAAVGIAGVISGMGTSQFTTQVNMSSFVQQQQLMSPGNFQGQRFANASRFQAFGGGNQNLNAIAQGPTDAAAGQFLINQIAGAPATPNGGAGNAFGAAGQGAASMFGYANPGVGASGAGALAQGMYNPSMTMRMMMMGYSRTPLSLSGGKPSSSGTVLQSMLQRMFNGKVTPKQLAFSMREGGIGQMDLQQLVGTNAATDESWTNTLEAFNRLQTGAGGNKPLGVNQIQTLFSQAAKGQVGAQNTLQSYGINRSDLQNIKNATAAKTGTSADIANSFNAGLQAATTSLTGFRKVLDGFARTPFGQAGAAGGGFAGTFASISNPGSVLSLGGSIAQIAMLKKITGIAKAVGGDAAGGAEAAGGAKAIAGGGGGELADLLGPAAGGLGMGIGAIKNLLGDVSRFRGAKGATGKATSIFQDATDFLTNPGGVLGWLAGGAVGGSLSKTGPSQASNTSRTSGSNQKMGGKGGASQGHTGISTAAMTAVTDAKMEVGVPYVFGGESPAGSAHPGFDCSGLVQWAYKQAGMDIPRTSELQWAAFGPRRSVQLDKVQAGDLVFQAGADGTTNNPGHVAMMTSHTQIVEAPHTGLNVRVRAYSDKEWTHAARPTGGLGGFSTLGSGGGPGSSSAVQGDAGLSASAAIGMGGDGSYGSSEELDDITAALMGGGGGGVGMGGTTTSGGGGSQTSPKGGGGGGGTGKLTAPGPGRVGWAEALLKGIGAPVNQQTKAAVVVWEVAEGGGFGNQAANNPLNLNPGAGAHWPGHNADGAWAFPTAADGLKESVAYLNMSNFAGINRALRSGKSEHNILEAIVNSPWASHHYAGNSEMEAGLKNTQGGRVWGLAAGTMYAPPGMYWTGERGPELKSFSGGEKVQSATASHDAAQAAKSPAEGMWHSLQPNGLHNKPTQGGGCKIDVHMNFASGAIRVGGDHKDPAKHAEDIIGQITHKLHNDKTLQEIAAGHTHG